MFITLNPDRGIFRFSSSNSPPLMLLLSGLEPNNMYVDSYTGHPVPTRASEAAKQRMSEVQGERGVYFAGAYLGYGFHEDGYKAGASAAHLVRLRSLNMLSMLISPFAIYSSSARRGRRFLTPRTGSCPYRTP